MRACPTTRLVDGFLSTSLVDGAGSDRFRPDPLTPFSGRCARGAGGPERFRDIGAARGRPRLGISVSATAPIDRPSNPSVGQALSCRGRGVDILFRGPDAIGGLVADGRVDAVGIRLRLYGFG